MASNRPTILLVEDDESLAEPLRFGLQAEGYRVLHAGDGPTGLEMALQHRPDLVLLDVMLPGMDGFTLCRRLRAESSVPVIMLTARGQEMERVMGLELGADDYIVKPFSFRELLARIKAVLRRRSPGPGPLLQVGPITLDRATRQAWVRGRPVDLRPREYELLRVLMEHAGRALSRQELLDLAWGPDWVGDPKTLDVHIHWLREKLEDDPSAPPIIHTVRGFGYRLGAPSSPEGT